MNAIMHTTFSQKKNTMKGKNKFNYQSFSHNLNKYKKETKATYFEIANKTGIGQTLLFQIIKNKYKSDLSVNYACILAEWMEDNICNYLK